MRAMKTGLISGLDSVRLRETLRFFRLRSRPFRKCVRRYPVLNTFILIRLGLGLRPTCSPMPPWILREMACPQLLTDCIPNFLKPFKNWKTNSAVACLKLRKYCYERPAPMKKLCCFVSAALKNRFLRIRFLTACFYFWRFSPRFIPNPSRLLLCLKNQNAACIQDG